MMRYQLFHCGCQEKILIITSFIEIIEIIRSNLASHWLYLLRNISYLCVIMKEETTPYQIRTEIECDVVCEPASEYKRTIAYHGVTITKALQDYYTFTTNQEKVAVLKWIVAQQEFTELQRYSTSENKIFTLYANQYDEILKTGETPNNMQIAQKFVSNGYDVYLLSNPKATKSADFIIRRRNCLYYVEGKTSSGGSSLVHRFENGAEQADKIAINFIGYPKTSEIIEIINSTFYNQANVSELFLFKGKRLITVSRDFCNSKHFENDFYRLWTKQK